jgi:hypothetical protein
MQADSLDWHGWAGSALGHASEVPPPQSQLNSPRTCTQRWYCEHGWPLKPVASPLPPALVQEAPAEAMYQPQTPPHGWGSHRSRQLWSFPVLAPLRMLALPLHPPGQEVFMDRGPRGQRNRLKAAWMVLPLIGALASCASLSGGARDTFAAQAGCPSNQVTIQSAHFQADPGCDTFEVSGCGQRKYYCCEHLVWNFNGTNALDTTQVVCNEVSEPGSSPAPSGSPPPSSGVPQQPAPTN